jgi:hypothetical protein
MRVFEESQKFTQTWVMLLVVVSLIFPIILIINDWGKQTDQSFSGNSDLIIALFIVILSISPLLLFKLKTRIDEKGIKYQFYPFHLTLRVIPWSEISEVYLRKYDAISEYGGWGLKGGFFFKKKGVAYNVSGNIGVQLILKSGKKILIGTKQKEKVQQVLAYYKNKEND